MFTSLAQQILDERVAPLHKLGALRCWIEFQQCRADELVLLFRSTKGDLEDQGVGVMRMRVQVQLEEIESVILFAAFEKASDFQQEVRHSGRPRVNVRGR